MPASAGSHPPAEHSPPAMPPSAVAALHKLPGAAFQLQRSPDGEWAFPFASEELQRILMTPAEQLARDAAVARRHIPPDDLGRLKHQLVQSREFGHTCRTRIRIRPPGVEDAWYEVTAAPETSFNGGTVWHGFLIDVTQEQRVNRELRTLHRRWTLAARAAGIGIIEFDPASMQLGLDAIACGHHDIREQQTWLPLQAWLQRLAPEDRLVAHQSLTSLPLEGFTEELVVRLPVAGGGPRTLQMLFQFVEEEQRLIGTCRDITEAENLEALRRDKLAAEKANQSKSEFMSRISHELRTPLNGVLGFVELMATDQSAPLSPQQRRRLEVIQQSGTRLMSLIDQLLDISRVEEGRAVMKPEPIDLGDAVDRCAVALLPQARAQGIVLTTAIAAEAPPVLADRDALAQVLDNLLSNAIKYNRPHGTVQVLFETAAGGEHGVLAVEDTGSGMTPAQLARLFEPFNRLGAERTEVRGTGLGLVITRKLVQAMQGDLRVHSKPGTGTRVEVLLPLADGLPAGTAPAARLAATARDMPPPPGAAFPAPPPSVAASALPAAPVPAPSPAPVQPATPARRHRVVLYIEDDEVNTLLMQHVFESLPTWRLVTAPNGQAGLALAASEHPDVILLDLHLPDMSGYEVLKQLRSQPGTRHIPCIAVSADAMPPQVKATLDLGFFRYWSKPIAIKEVVAGLEELFAALDAVQSR
ncbi:PAS domain-containing hybrid sensor histidine kinase/response regulator [Aquincola tertiaricarbonis]|uniref:PAS domain-containing hybrid sensor histidine kinase/response regulator n=1 Tax=Aquincola tertiaricarbonis TaxID=391953 RepID=UPI0018DD3FB5|nr:ATP-binding protein [Aquincola tertiaricarbonis]